MFIHSFPSILLKKKKKKKKKKIGTPSDLMPVELGGCGYEKGSDGLVVTYMTDPGIYIYIFNVKITSFIYVNININ